MLMELGKQVGSCSDCDGSGTIETGLRMEVRGTVQSLEPPVIDISEVKALIGDEQGCLEFAVSTADGAATDGNVTDFGDDAEEDSFTTTTTDPAEGSGAIPTNGLVVVSSLVTGLVMIFFV